MPEISRFFGIVIQMYPRDHLPPHFHALYSGSDAVIGIAPVALLEGRLSPRVLALIVEWSQQHQAELLANWDRLERGQPAVRIPRWSSAMNELPPGMPFPRITAVDVVPPYGLHLTFEDGTSGVVDGSRWLKREPLGVFAPLRDPAEFAKVHLRPDLGTIAWSDDLDLCPDVLYALAHGIALPGVD